MTLKQTMSALKKAGTAQNRKIYARHGATGEMFGVSFANLRQLKKQIKTDQKLAEDLWVTGNTDARTLAALVAIPAAFGKSDLDRWLRQMDYYMLADVFVKEVVAKSVHARSRLEKWIDLKHEWQGRAGWVLLANMAIEENDLSDRELEGLLKRIERDIHGAPNLTRDAMNSALISVGIRNDKLRKLANGAAKRIGKVEVDHGETGCKTPDALAYIAKTWARRKNRFQNGTILGLGRSYQ